MPIGIEDFKKLRENNFYYVDKSLLIKELLDNRSEVSLFMRPRRFGKTLSLSMLRYYFEQVPVSDTNTDNNNLFKGLKIMEAGEKYTKHKGRYPVVNLSLKSAKQPDWNMAYDAMVNEIAKEFERHDDVLESSRLLPDEKELFCRIRGKKAARIDKTNTTTLRFLREVDEQTGVTTKLEEKRKGRKKEIPDERENRSVVYQSGNDIVIQPPAYRENTMMSTLINMGVGFAIGAAALWFLVVPSIRQGIYREANEQIVDYSESMASQSAELSRAQSELEYSDSEKKEVQTQITQAQKESESYEALLAAYKAYQEKDMDEAAAQLQKVYVSSLSESASGIYSIISNETGATGIVDDEAASDEGQSDGDSSDEDSQDTSGYDDYGDYDADYQDDGSDWYTGEE